jgi:hypothetical protein
MTKRVLKQIRLDKIAAVDRPCQEGAVAAILKRAPTKEGNMSKLSNEELEKRVDELIAEIDKRTRFTLHHDDGDHGDGGNYNYQDGSSNPSMSADDGDGSDYETPKMKKMIKSENRLSTLRSCGMMKLTGQEPCSTVTIPTVPTNSRPW